MPRLPRSLLHERELLAVELLESPAQSGPPPALDSAAPLAGCSGAGRSSSPNSPPAPAAPSTLLASRGCRPPSTPPSSWPSVTGLLASAFPNSFLKKVLRFLTIQASMDLLPLFLGIRRRRGHWHCTAAQGARSRALYRRPASLPHVHNMDQATLFNKHSEHPHALPPSGLFVLGSISNG